MKLKVLLFVFLFALGQQVESAVNPVPNDPLTLEALISLHKTTAKAERAALGRIAASLGIQYDIKRNTNLVQEVRDIMKTKTSNLYSYVLLASRLAYIGKGLYNLSNSYADFTAAASSSLFKKPMVLWYYSEAMTVCGREVKAIVPLLARFTASQFLSNSTMDDNLLILASIQASIDRCQHAIEQAYLWASLVVNGGYTRLFLDDIFNSKLTDQIATSVISLYYSV